MGEPRITSPVTDNLFPEAWKGTPGNGTSSIKGEFSVKIVKNLKIAEFLLPYLTSPAGDNPICVFETSPKLAGRSQKLEGVTVVSDRMWF